MAGRRKKRKLKQTKRAIAARRRYRKNKPKTFRSSARLRRRLKGAALKAHMRALRKVRRRHRRGMRAERRAARRSRVRRIRRTVRAGTPYNFPRPLHGAALSAHNRKNYRSGRGYSAGMAAFNAAHP